MSDESRDPVEAYSWMRELVSTMQLRPDDAENLVQSAFLVLLERIGLTGPDPENPLGLLQRSVSRPYVSTALRNRWRSIQRAEQRRQRDRRLVDVDMFISNNRDTHLFELVEALEQALERASPRDGTLLIMRYLEGRTNAEIAHHLEMEESAVSTAISRARIRVRKILDDLRFDLEDL